ncbi:MAG TPA: VCBS repeat-containing protein, partial [Dongiaceae bacterium]|nr:VCBS repeat-containing protein [Dongiaceae bacterium]
MPFIPAGASDGRPRPWSDRMAGGDLDIMSRSLRAFPRLLARVVGLLVAILPVAASEVWAAARPLLDDYQATPSPVVFGRLIVGDFDNDGLQDAVVVPGLSMPGPVHFLRNRGDGTF